MKLEIKKINDEYRLIIKHDKKLEILFPFQLPKKSKAKTEIRYIKDSEQLIQYVLDNLLYYVEGKSKYFERDFHGVVNIEYEEE